MPCCYFNPRARVGRDTITEVTLDMIYNFNPRARVGRDGRSYRKVRREFLFQSTRPRGARPR